MAALFFDTQDGRNPDNGVSVRNAAQLAELLAHARGRKPFFLMLKGDQGRTMLVGFGTGIGCIQYTDERGIATMAVSPAPPADMTHVDFLTADTPTPVPARYCMPLPRVESIAAHFVAENDRDEGVAWETI